MVSEDRLLQHGRLRYVFHTWRRSDLSEGCASQRHLSMLSDWSSKRWRGRMVVQGRTSTWRHFIGHFIVPWVSSPGIQHPWPTASDQTSRAGRFAFEEWTCPLQRRMGMTRTGRSSSSTQTHFCRRLRGLPRGGNQPWCSSSLGLVCMCAVPVTQSSAMVFSSDARGVFRESPLLIPPAGSRAAGNGKRGCRHQGPRKGHCAPAAPCRRGGCECLHFCICESSARCDLSLLA